MRMALAGASPSARDRSEFRRMGTEKIAAFTESWNAMAVEAVRANQQLALSCMQAFWFPWARPRRRARRTALGILGAGMAPVHRRALANAKRLGRASRRRR